MPDINDLYGGSLLKAADLKGRAVKVVIESWRTQEFDDKGKKKEKLILAFAGKDKEFVLNSTNAMMLAARLGSDYDAWAGKAIEIYPDKTQFQGNIVDCLKVRVPTPAAVDDEAVPF